MRRNAQIVILKLAAFRHFSFHATEEGFLAALGMTQWKEARRMGQLFAIQ
jgi:hypothetical protein